MKNEEYKTYMSAKTNTIRPSHLALKNKKYRIEHQNNVPNQAAIAKCRNVRHI